MLILNKAFAVAQWGDQLLQRDIVQLDDLAAEALLTHRRNAIALRLKQKQKQLQLERDHSKPTTLNKLWKVVGYWEDEVDGCDSQNFKWTNSLWYEKGLTELYDHDQPAGMRASLAYCLERLHPENFDEALQIRIDAADQRYRRLTMASALSFSDLVHDVPLDPETEWYYYRQPFDYSPKVIAMGIAQWMFARWHILDFLYEEIDPTAINPDYVRLHLPEFWVGTDVNHKFFGNGCVTALDAVTDSIVVNFGGKGEKNMSLSGIRESLVMVPANWLTA
jgi:hypothetical protein